MSAVSAITTTLSGRTWTKPPTIANDSSWPPLRIRSSPTPSVESSGAWCGRTPSSPSLPGSVTPSTVVAEGEPLRRDDLELERHPLARASFSAFSRTSSIVPARKNACSGSVSVLPSRISLNDATVSLIETYLPGRPVKTSATKNGWLVKRWRRRARATVALSSSDSSSMPRIAMMSWRSR